MKPNEIGKAYDSITHLWQSEKFNRENGIAQHQRALKFVTQKNKALDIGCGCTGRFIDLLQSQGFEVEALDVSKKMLALAKKRHPAVTFYHEDICQWQTSEQYDFISAWDSIWHIPLGEQKPVLTKIINLLRPGGVFIFSFGATDASSDHVDDFMGPEVYYSTLGTNGFIQLLIDLGCHIKHMELDQHPELHSYLIVQKP